MVAITKALAKTACGVALATLAFACSPGPEPVSQSPRDPSSPTAPEGVTPAVAASAAGAPAPNSQGQAHHHHGHDARGDAGGK